MNKKRLLCSISQVMVGRIAVLLSGLVTGFVLPKVLGVTDYGYLKIYTLYTVYTSLLHCGFVDGILLKYAGRSYEELDFRELRSCSQFFIFFQLVLSGILCATSFTTSNPKYRVIICALGAQLFLNNVTTYYQFLSQATQRFKEYTARSILQAISKALLVVIMLVGSKVGALEPSFSLYLLLVNAIDAVLLLWYVATYREITFGARVPFRSCRPIFQELFRLGFPLTLAYQTAQLVFALDRQFISVLFDTAIYGIYSFAYSIVHMVSQIISSASTVLLPSLKQLPKQKIEHYYPITLNIVMMIAGAALIGYFPLEKIIQWYLPEYITSLSYLRIILPTVIYTCCISVVMFTFYKIENRCSLYLKVCCTVLCLGFLMNFIAYKLAGTPQSISWASVITVALWFALAGRNLASRGTYLHARGLIYILLLSAAFYMTTALGVLWWQGVILYFVAFSIISFPAFARIFRRRVA